MRFVIFGLILLFSLTTIVGCSTSDSGSDLLNQAMVAPTTVRSSTNVAAAGKALNSEDNSALIDDSIQVKPNIEKTSVNNQQLQVVKVSSAATIVPLKEAPVPAPNQVTPKVVTAEVPNKMVTEVHQYTVLKVDKKVPPEQKVWKIYLNDKVISNTLERWAEEGGYQLVWKSQHDFEITSEATVNGSMRDAFNQVLLSFVDTSTPIKAVWYKNKVIVITSFSE